MFCENNNRKSLEGSYKSKYLLAIKVIHTYPFFVKYLTHQTSMYDLGIKSHY